MHLAGASVSPASQGNSHLNREGALPVRLLCRTAIALASAALLASCSSTADPIERLGLTPQALTPQYTSGPVASAAADAGNAGHDIKVAEAQTGYSLGGENAPALPQAVPTPRPGEPQALASQSPSPAQQLQAEPVEVAVAPSQADIEAVVQTRIGPAGAVIENVPPPAATVAAPPPKKRSLFASLFGAADQPSAPAPAATVTPVAASETRHSSAQAESEQPAAAGEPAAAEPVETKVATATTFIESRPPAAEPVNVAGPKKRSFLSSFFSKAEAAPAPLVVENSRPLTLAAVAPTPAQPRAFMNTDPLPGVRQGDLFEIKRKSGMDDDSDIDLHEGDEEIEVASAAGLARLAPNGLLMQTDRVDTACLKPSLVRVLRTIEGHYGKKVLVTSGYRSPPVNRKARGARNSLHMYCAAADIQVEGVAKWELAEFLRSMPGRGGVGTYCHTNSVHVDVGPERDWNWRCRKRKRS